MDKILMMLQLQQQLNDATNGENWTEGITKNGKEINWKRCIYMECAEMIDSFSWKHWKNISQEPDWDNLKIEVVDVWHFIMSLAIEDYAKNMRGQLEDMANQIAELPSYEKIQKTNNSFASQKEIIAKVELLMIDALSRKSLDITAMVNHFFELVVMSGLDITGLYRLYVGKNILNQFRQDHGYKDGTYIKVWNGLEDNVIMKRIWEENGDIKPEILYKKMKEVYDNLED
ncbi:dUTP diphosphatase [bacterium]|nr:dUTP diphosphatase [bacterium]MBU1883896.1 dUTP diphosphatase [bacterium]